MDRAVFFLFVALVLLAPLPFGGNVPAAWTADSFVAGLLVIIVSVQNLVLKRAPAVPLRWIAFPTSLFVLVCLWAAIQSLSLAPSFMHNPLWSAASEAFGEPLSGAISANPFETRVSLMRLLTYGVAFWMALQLARDRSRAVFLLHAIAIGIALYVLYGLVLWSVGSELIPWYDEGAGRGAVTSTFVNRNNFATFAGMGSVIFLGLVLHKTRQILRRGEGERFKYRFERVLSSLASLGGLYLIGLLMTLGAVFLTQSRAGFLATLAALGSLIVLSLRRRTSTGARHSGRGGVGIVRLLTIFVVAVGAILATFSISGEQITTRLVNNELSDAGRKAVYPRLIEAIKDYPLLGTGYGSFEDMFPLYRDESISAYGRWDKAHSTYLEVMMELGLPAASMLFLAIGTLIYLCLRGAITRQRDSYIPLIVFAASILGVQAFLKGRLILETKSSTTYENATVAASLVSPQPTDRWMIVTSAPHMPRAVGVFRKAGFNVYPWPVFYGTRAGRLSWKVAIHEWMGLICYRLMGRTNTLFPSQ